MSTKLSIQGRRTCSNADGDTAEFDTQEELTRGGQGRSDESMSADAFVVGVCLAIVGAGILVWVLLGMPGVKL